MKLLCHRGNWSDKSQRNSLASLKYALQEGHGVETDVRDCNGSLVISHDMPMFDDALTLNEFLEVYVKIGKPGMLALNIKSDGLQIQLKDLLIKYAVTEYVVFDMSIPDTFGYIREKMAVAVRMSEYEDGQWLLNDVDTIWLDAFNSEWYNRNTIVSLLELGNRVFVVSPELHGRAHLPLWSILQGIPAHLVHNVYLCTDLVTEAMENFDVTQY